MEPIIDLTKNKIEEAGVDNFKKTNLLSYTIAIFVVGFLFAVSIISYFLFITPPANFKSGTVIHITSGESVNEIAQDLFNENIISSPFVFKIIVLLTERGKILKIGDYLFDDRENVYDIVVRISNGNYGIEEQTILIREGLSRKEMSTVFKDRLPLFSVEDFMDQTKNDEGYLFPDTYKFFRTASTSIVILNLKNNFKFRTSSLRHDSDSLGDEWESIIKVASLVELEGKTKEDRAMIADIIYRRLKNNMPLQLDAPFLYYMNKASLQLTKEDLFTESPYNTYRNKGLPPTPICSPGIESINAAIHPEPNEYLYYLSDKEGKIHYAKNFEEHKANKKLYLNN